MNFLKSCLERTRNREGGLLLGILRGGVPPGSPTPDPIPDQKVSFSTPVFRPGLLEVMSS